MFPVYVFLTFLGINAFERGVMNYHDRRIARERTRMAEQRKNQQRASLSDDDFDYNFDSDWSVEDLSLKPSIRRKHSSRGPRKTVHFAPGTRNANTWADSAYSRDSYSSKPTYTRDNSQAGARSGTHWDSFINDWADEEPLVNPWGIVPPAERQNLSSYTREPHAQAARTGKSTAPRRASSM